VEKGKNYMKWNRVCPKCKSDDTIIVYGERGSYGAGNYIETGTMIQRTILVDRYVCCSCGFTEEWVRLEDIEVLKKSKKAHR
jgi:ribosomal protein S27AE